MAEYKKSEAKEWERTKFRDVENVLMPSFKPVKIGKMPGMNRLLRSLLAAKMGNGEMLFLDEAGIQHDVSMCIRHGFYASTVSIEGIHFIMQDMVVRLYYQIVKDEAKGQIVLDAYIGNNTFDENIKCHFLVAELGAQWAGSSPYEYLQTPENPRLVKHFDLLLKGNLKEAMKLYWEMTPARDTFEEIVMPTVAMGNYNIMH